MHSNLFLFCYLNAIVTSLCLVGDPKQDLAYERQYEQQTYQVIPEVIKNFIQYFHKTVSDLIDQKVYELQASRVSSDVIDQKVYEIQDIYENRYGFSLQRIGGGGRGRMSTSL